MTPEASIALVETFWNEVWAACNPAAIDRFVTEDFVITTAGVDVAGPEDFKAWGCPIPINHRRSEVENYRNLLQLRRLPCGLAVSGHRQEQRHVWAASRR